MSVERNPSDFTVEACLQSAAQALRLWEEDIFFEALKTPLRSAYASIFESPDGAFEIVRRKLENAKKRTAKPFHMMNIEAPGGCWELGTQINPDIIRITAPNRHLIETHTYRFVFLFCGAIVADPQDVVRHQCNNRACIRPDHMLLGSQAQNMLDEARRKYAGNSPQGRGQALHAHVTKQLQLRPDPWVDEPLCKSDDTDMRRNLGDEIRLS